jgi:GNAT superfamily N-acetyltransferase
MAGGCVSSCPWDIRSEEGRHNILPTDLRIRRATLNDAAILAKHRVAMFRDMGALEAASESALTEASTAYFTAAVPRGEYLAWLVHASGSEQAVVAGGGVLVRTLLPRPDADKRRLLIGSEALVLNVYVEPEWRRRGLARSLMETILDWARGAGIARVVLHASGDGKPLYESLGFISTSEMRYAGSLEERQAP